MSEQPETEAVCPTCGQSAALLSPLHAEAASSDAGGEAVTRGRLAGRFRLTAIYHARADQNRVDVERSLIDEEISHIRYGLVEGLYHPWEIDEKLAEIAGFEAERAAL